MGVEMKPIYTGWCCTFIKNPYVCGPPLISDRMDIPV